MSDLLAGLPGGDNGHPFLEAVAQLRVSIDTQTAQQERAREAERARHGAGPFTIRKAAAFICPNPSVPFVLNLGQPDMGWFWEVDRISVGGGLTTDVRAGRADVFVTGANLNTGSAFDAQVLTIADWVDQTTSLPNVAGYGRGQVALRDQENLLVIITNGTVGSLYVASAQIQNAQEALIKRTVSS